MGTLTEGGRLSTVHLLALISLDQLLLILKNTIYDFTKQAILFRRSIVLSLSLWIVFPARGRVQATDVFAKPSTTDIDNPPLYPVKVGRCRALPEYYNNVKKVSL
jgi:hypothetical protein